MLDGARDATMQLGRNACRAPRVDFPGLGSELSEKFRILVVELLSRNIEATPRHLPIVPSEILGSFFCLWLHE